MRPGCGASACRLPAACAIRAVFAIGRRTMMTVSCSGRAWSRVRHRGGRGTSAGSIRRSRIRQRRKRACARLQGLLAADQVIDLLLDLLLVDELAAREPVDLGAQLGDAIFVGVLHLRLAGEQAGQHVVAEGEIGGGDDRPAGHDHECADDGPECDRPDAHLALAMAERPVALRPRPRLRSAVTGMLVTGMGPLHRDSRAVRNRMTGADLSAAWLIFCQRNSQARGH